MSVDLDLAKKQVVSLLNANTRTLGVASYSTTPGDLGWLAEEIDTAVDGAALATLQAACEGVHPARQAFIVNTTVTHAAALPLHYGAIGVPVITPYDGAAFTIQGVRKSVDDISAYRINESNIYGSVAHNLANGTKASQLAGYYAHVNGIFYFTGFSCVVPLAILTRSSTTSVPDVFEPTIIKLAMGSLAKDGAASDNFSYFQQLGMTDLNTIRAGGNPPPVNATEGQKDIGTR